MKKKIISLFLLSIMIMSMTILTFANNTEGISQDETILQRAEAPCHSGNGIHQMRRRGVGSVFDNNGALLIYHKPCWQCDNCYDVIITSDDPTGYGGIVGYYAMGGSEDPIALHGTELYVASSSSLGYCGTKTMEGFRFFNQQREVDL